MLSSLPADVQEGDVEDLLKKTVGPLKDVFLIYNSQGKSKGMAVVTFQRPGDAAVACTKYDGKIVDGRKPLRIEIVGKAEAPKPLGFDAPSAPSAPRSLTERIGGVAKAVQRNGAPPPSGPKSKANGPRLPNSVLPGFLVGQQQQQRNSNVNGVLTPRKPRVKKGAKRVQKRGPATRDELDQEMEDYRSKSTGGNVVMKGTSS